MLTQHLAITTNRGHQFVKKTSILYCCSEGAYTNIYLEGGKKITVSKNLKEVSSVIQDAQFVRIHASHLINLDHTIGYINNGHNCVKMSNGEELAVSRSRKADLMNCFLKI